MLFSLNNLSTEDLESWRAVLNWLLIVSTFAVGIGVYFERDFNPKDVQEYGYGLVFKGIAFEVLFAALLWQIDSVVANRQKDEVAALHVKAAEALKSASDANERAPTAELELARYRAPWSLN